MTDEERKVIIKDYVHSAQEERINSMRDATVVLSRLGFGDMSSLNGKSKGIHPSTGIKYHVKYANNKDYKRGWNGSFVIDFS